MADESSDERTEEPTSKRLSQAKERGELPRSSDFSGALILVFAAGILYFSGLEIYRSVAAGLVKALEWPSVNTLSVDDLPGYFGTSIVEGISAGKWIIIGCLAVALLAPIFNGGYNFSAKASSLNFGKLNPINGLKRNFGGQALLALSKNLAKFSLILGAIIYLLWVRRVDILASYRQPFESMVSLGSGLALEIFIIVTLISAAFALVDVPYQRWKFYQRLRMTKQEVRDELKDMEGRPEIRRQIRKRQREIGRSRMIENVKTADVVIINPSEFAVALSYDEARNSVPVVVAKGRNEIALAIKSTAKKHGVPEVSAPVLARAIYFTTDLDMAIPEPLYRAVAAVLAYVFRVSSLDKSLLEPSPPVPEVPKDYQYDEFGKLSGKDV